MNARTDSTRFKVRWIINRQPVRKQRMGLNGYCIENRSDRFRVCGKWTGNVDPLPVPGFYRRSHTLRHDSCDRIGTSK